MTKPTIILATSNGIGMGHLTRASAVASELKDFANPIIISMASGVVEVPKIAYVNFEYVPGRDRKWMGRFEWDKYLRDRIVALIDETDAKIVSFDGVVPYPGIIGIKSIRPKVKLVWVRRGFWQKTSQRHLLNLQSKMMDLIITPGDFGQSYDKGPTAGRSDSTVVKPISIYNRQTSLDKVAARNLLGLDQTRPVVLVQLGIGEADLNAKMTAALKGLITWPDLQVVLTKEPVTSTGENLAPAGLDMKVIRHFPLANVLNAFDAAICAAGYNSVHEELAANIPTLMVSKLSDSKLRQELAKNCANLPQVTGATEVANIFRGLINKPDNDNNEISKTLFKLKLQDIFGRGWRGTVYSGLQLLTIIYRMIKPHKEVKVTNASEIKTFEGNESEQLGKLIKSGNPFEHLLSGASAAYKDRRIEIASKAYLK